MRVSDQRMLGILQGTVKIYIDNGQLSLAHQHAGMICIQFTRGRQSLSRIVQFTQRYIGSLTRTTTGASLWLRSLISMLSLIQWALMSTLKCVCLRSPVTSA